MPVISYLFFNISDTAFSLHPPHVWYGEVKARQIGTGGLSLCADQSWSLAEADEVCRDLGKSINISYFDQKLIQRYA